MPWNMKIKSRNSSDSDTTRPNFSKLFYLWTAELYLLPVIPSDVGVRRWSLAFFSWNAGGIENHDWVSRSYNRRWREIGGGWEWMCSNPKDEASDVDCDMSGDWYGRFLLILVVVTEALLRSERRYMTDHLCLSTFYAYDWVHIPCHRIQELPVTSICCIIIQILKLCLCPLDPASLSECKYLYKILHVSFCKIFTLLAQSSCKAVFILQNWWFWIATILINGGIFQYQQVMRTLPCQHSRAFLIQSIKTFWLQISSRIVSIDGYKSLYKSMQSLCSVTIQRWFLRTALKKGRLSRLSILQSIPWLFVKRCTKRFR